jgi:CBS domain-containing protein
MEKTIDPRVTAVLAHNPTLKFVGVGSITDILDAAEATKCLAPARKRPTIFRIALGNHG